jgi:hypothetical protein
VVSIALVAKTYLGREFKAFVRFAGFLDILASHAK